MYQVDRRMHHHNKLRRFLRVLVPLLLLALIVFLLYNLRITPEQNIKNSPPVSQNYKATEAAKIKVEKPELRFELPAGWKELSYEKSPTAPRYGFRNAQIAQQLEVYIDNPPVNMAINKAIVVSASGDGLAYDAVSDNCTTYTGPLKAGQTGNLPAKWQGTDFICDMGNFQRAVVGTVSKDGINFVNINGPTIGQHKVFFTYTDNNNNPDYSVFYDILRSLHFK